MTFVDEATALGTERLIIEPLRPEDADELVDVLADERLHAFIGGRPATLEELRDCYQRLIAGSSRPGEIWLNWVVRRRFDFRPIGTLQATLTCHGGRWVAYVAWVIANPWQSQGFATEAARALVDWLEYRAVDEIVAHIHPHHRASAIVATRAGLRPTDEEADGERVWRLTRGRQSEAQGTAEAQPHGPIGPPVGLCP
jgi:RimJ/RimL family protein N-acetyltransferase